MCDKTPNRQSFEKTLGIEDLDQHIATFDRSPPEQRRAQHELQPNVKGNRSAGDDTTRTSPN